VVVVWVVVQEVVWVVVVLVVVRLVDVGAPCVAGKLAS
jgi:hypothetical protein